VDIPTDGVRGGWLQRIRSSLDTRRKPPMPLIPAMDGVKPAWWLIPLGKWL